MSSCVLLICDRFLFFPCLLWPWQFWRIVLWNVPQIRCAWCFLVIRLTNGFLRCPQMTQIMEVTCPTHRTVTVVFNVKVTYFWWPSSLHYRVSVRFRHCKFTMFLFHTIRAGSRSLSAAQPRGRESHVSKEELWDICRHMLKPQQQYFVREILRLWKCSLPP